ncbi:hypothetical protein ATANTOWER_029883 [Ataeniobius toweri]|uniref:Uncharacterized protein n=1 Tax=Ataeniobius toweri TaxID=208326 RepID=A0ABU7AJJ5_9TELE|nr:hypothetical protein [Ataeniobius toweri]
MVKNYFLPFSGDSTIISVLLVKASLWVKLANISPPCLQALLLQNKQGAHFLVTSQSFSHFTHTHSHTLANQAVQHRFLVHMRAYFVISQTPKVIHSRVYSVSYGLLASHVAFKVRQSNVSPVTSVCSLL